MAKDSTATTEITMTAPADDERGGVLMGPEKTKLCAMIDWWVNAQLVSLLYAEIFSARTVLQFLVVAHSQR